jgi:glycosyltransferase involved in cell wall biosynthesis
MVIAVSREEAIIDELMGALPDNIRVIYNGMDLESFKNIPPYGKFKNKYSINGKMILYVGRLHKTKGIDFLINSFSRVVNDINDSTLIIAGADDGYKSTLEKLIEQLNIKTKVKFIGFIDEENKICAYADADLFVHTVTYMGGVGISPLEAILCGTPIIVTDECGEIIKEAGGGYIVRYGDMEDLGSKMKCILRNREIARKKVENVKNYINTNLSWDKVTDKVVDCYIEALNRR